MWKPYKLTCFITLNDERLEAFPLISWARQGCPLIPALFNVVSDVLVNAVRQGNKMYIHWEERKKTLCTEDVVISVENLNQQTPGTNKHFQKGSKIEN